MPLKKRQCLRDPLRDDQIERWREVDHLTLREIAERLHICVERVRQLYGRILRERNGDAAEKWSKRWNY